MPSVDSLNPDILFTIFVLTGEGQRAPLLAICLVSREWHGIAQTIIDATVDLTICSPYEARNLLVLQRLQTDEAFQARVHHLMIRDLYSEQRVPLGVAEEPQVDASRPGEYFSEDYELVEVTELGLRIQIDAVQAVIGAAQLRSFSWTAIQPLPLILAESLESQSSIDIHIHLNRAAIDTAAWSYTPVASRKTLQRLFPLAAQLASLELCLPNQAEYLDITLPELKRLLACCVKLDTFGLHALARRCTTSYGTYGLRGVDGPSRQHAASATVADYADWGTNIDQDSSSNGRLLDLWSPCFSSLTSLSLQNFCVCALDSTSLIQTLRLPRLRNLHVSCSSLLDHISRSRSELRTLSLDLPGRDGDSNSPAPGRRSCEIGASKTLEQFENLHELLVFGNVEVVAVSTLLRLSSTLHKLVLLPHAPYDHRRTSYLSSAPYPRGLQLPELVASIGEACPDLEQLTCDAPNASAEFDTFLSKLILHLPKLKDLSLYRSPEPYGDVFWANKLSYARFTRSSVLTVWEHLAAETSLQTLMVTIGSHRTWDSTRSDTKIAPSPRSRSLLIRRKLPRRSDNSDDSFDLSYCELDDARLALTQDRPGPLQHYWHVQSKILEDFAKEQNEPVYPQAPLLHGHEVKFKLPHPGPAARRSSAYQAQRKARHEEHVKLLQAQHEAQIEEAARPTRRYY